MHSTKIGSVVSLSSSKQTRFREGQLGKYFESGFAYSRKLTEHTSCVNSLAFSSGEGRWLASAGDDRRILLWDMHQENITKPSCTLHGHRANIFTLDFSASNQYVYSGGTDDLIMKYDLTRWQPQNPGFSDSQVEIFHQHRDSIRAVSCHPSQDAVFLSASEDGSIMLHDGRAGSGTSQAQATLQQTTEFTGVQYHPRMEHIFATSDNRGKVYLRDVRMAFGPLRARTKQGIVQTYATTLARKTERYKPRCHPEASSMTFDSEGKKLAVALLHHLPTIYSIHDPFPLATCSGRNTPDGRPVPPGTRTLSNSCTIKHGSFGGPGKDGDGYFAFGSDDFRGYLWKLPSSLALEEQRQLVEKDDWATNDWPDIIGEYTRARSLIRPVPYFQGLEAFTGANSEVKCIPVELSTPLCHLNGHKSIANTIVIHPVFPIIMSAGIERDILMHSPSPSSPSGHDFTLTSTDAREIPEASIYTNQRLMATLMDIDAPLQPEEDHGVDENGRVIALFDEIIRQEGETDVFRGSAMSASDSSDSDSGEQSDSSVDADADSIEP